MIVNSAKAVFVPFYDHSIEQKDSKKRFQIPASIYFFRTWNYKGASSWYMASSSLMMLHHQLSVAYRVNFLV